MSIVSMADAKVMRESPDPKAGTPEAEAPAVPQNLLNQLMRYIPTESVTLYVAFLAAFFDPLKAPAGGEIADLSFRGRWIGFVVFLGLTLILVPVLYLAKAKKANQRFTMPYFEMLVAPIAFAAWAFALPDNPLLTISGWSEARGAFIVLATTGLIGVAADALGKAPGRETLSRGRRGLRRRK